MDVCHLASHRDIKFWSLLIFFIVINNDNDDNDNNDNNNNEAKFVKLILTLLRTKLLAHKNKNETWTPYKGQEHKQMALILRSSCHLHSTVPFKRG